MTAHVLRAKTQSYAEMWNPHTHTHKQMIYCVIEQIWKIFKTDSPFKLEQLKEDFFAEILYKHAWRTEKPQEIVG